MILRLADRKLQTKYGTYLEVLYYDGQKESMAIVMGDVSDGDDVLCRVHSHCVGAHIFNSVECDCREQMAAAQVAIQTDGRGVIIWLDQEAKGNGHLALIQSTPFKKSGNPQAIAYEQAGFEADARNYRSAAQILHDLKIRSVVLLANDSRKFDALQKVGIVVNGFRKLAF